jgi:CO dehydrogenase maturation factor
MRLAVTGKGGVGKTLFSSTLARIYAGEGRNVFAIDADSASNLAAGLGFPPDVAAQVTPISTLKKLLDRRTTDAPIKMVDGRLQAEPEVSDLPDRYAVTYNGVQLLKMGTIPEGGSGCACGINSALRKLLGHLLFEPQDVVILDMEAGIEHLGRSTAKSVDFLVVVVEPGRVSLEVARTIRRLAADIGLESLYAVANRVRDEREAEIIEKGLDGIPLLGSIPYDPDLALADLEGKTPYEASEQIVEAVRSVKARLESGVS